MQPRQPGQRGIVELGDRHHATREAEHLNDLKDMLKDTRLGSLHRVGCLANVIARRPYRTMPDRAEKQVGRLGGDRPVASEHGVQLGAQWGVRKHSPDREHVRGEPDHRRLAVHWPVVKRELDWDWNAVAHKQTVPLSSDSPGKTGPA